MSPVLSGVFAGEAARYLLLGMMERTWRSLILFVGQTRVSVVNGSTASSRSRQNSGSSRPRCCAVEFFGPGMRGTLASPQRNSQASWVRVRGGIAARRVLRASFSCRQVTLTQRAKEQS